MIDRRFRPTGIAPGRFVVGPALGGVGYVGYFVSAAFALQLAGAAIPPVVIGTMPVFLAMLANRRDRSAPWRAVVMGLAGSWLATWCWVVASRCLPLALASQLIVTETVFGLGYGFLFEERWPASAESIGAAFQVAGVRAAIAVFSRPTLSESAGRLPA